MVFIPPPSCRLGLIENMNKQLNEIRKTMQDMKEEFNKDIEILEKINLRFWK
jgi:hypothetical protein